MTIEKKYKDEAVWQPISEDLAIAFIGQEYDNPEAILNDLYSYAEEHGMSYELNTPFAIYRVVS